MNETVQRLCNNWRFKPADLTDLSRVNQRGLTIVRGSSEDVKTGEHVARYIVRDVTNDGLILSADELRQLGQQITKLVEAGEVVDVLDDGKYQAIVKANKQADAQRNKRLW